MGWKCYFMQKQISAYIDGTLLEQKGRRLEAHLSACPNCRRFLEQARRLDDALLNLPSPEVPLEGVIAARVRRRIAESRARALGKNPDRLRWAFSLPNLASAAILGIGLLIGALLGRQIAAPGLPLRYGKDTQHLDRVAEVVFDVAGYQTAVEASPMMQEEDSR